MKNLLLILVIILQVPIFSISQDNSTSLLKKLAKYTESIVMEFDQIPEERKLVLQDFGEYIFTQTKANKPIQVTVICTHNSRRSHMGQLWLLSAAAWYGIDNLTAYSGGTESTALNPRAVDALGRAGFKILQENNATNPRYKAKYLKGLSNKSTVTMYSKHYQDALNPKTEFAAVMVCSEADKSCPVVAGADERFSIPFEDPRYYDDTASEVKKYDEICRSIAREMYFAMNHAKEKMILELESLK